MVAKMEKEKQNFQNLSRGQKEEMMEMELKILKQKKALDELETSYRKKLEEERKIWEKNVAD